MVENDAARTEWNVQGRPRRERERERQGEFFLSRARFCLRFYSRKEQKYFPETASVRCERTEVRSNEETVEVNAYVMLEKKETGPLFQTR